MTEPITVPNWVPAALKLAAVYNVIWGTLVILFPLTPFRWMGVAEPNYPAIIQCLGMVVGVYGVAYWIAAGDPVTHWPVVFAGLLGKILGPIGFVSTALLGDLPWSMGLTLLSNDLIWWVPFTAILIQSARIHELRRSKNGLTLEQALRGATLSDGTNLYDRSMQKPLLLVCVRHMGCTFCREALADLARQRSEVERQGLTPVIVSMGSSEQATPMLVRYGISDVAHVSDPDRQLFRALELPFGSLSQIMGWKTLWRAIVGGTAFRYGFGRMIGNGLQLSGAFIVKNGHLERAVRHQSSDERTDFAEFSCQVN